MVTIFSKFQIGLILAKRLKNANKCIIISYFQTLYKYIFLGKDRKTSRLFGLRIINLPKKFHEKTKPK